MILDSIADIQTTYGFSLFLYLMSLLEPTLGVEPPYKVKGLVAMEVSIIKHEAIDFFTVKCPHLGKFRGKILILHGWCEHSTMYYRVMEYLSSLGYQSFVFDQRGSGRTSLGKYRGRCGRSEHVVYKDVDKMIEIFLENQYPIWLLGHLAGGGIALNYAINGKYKDNLKGVITVGPMIRVADHLCPSPVIEGLLSWVGHWFPYMPWGSINRDPLVKSVITSAEEWVSYLQNELMTQGNCTLGQIKFMFDRGHKLSSMQPEDITMNPQLKLLIIHCVDDPMTSYRQLKMFFNNVPLRNKKFVSVERATHALFIETEQIFQETCTEICNFLN